MPEDSGRSSSEVACWHSSLQSLSKVKMHSGRRLTLSQSQVSNRKSFVTLLTQLLTSSSPSLPNHPQLSLSPPFWGCDSWLYVTVTNNWDNKLMKRKGLFWFPGWEASVHDQAHCFGYVIANQEGEMCRSKAIYFMVGSKRQEETGVPQFLSRPHLLLKFPTSPYLLKFPLPHNSVKLGTHPLIQGPWRDILNSTYSRE